MQLPDMLVEYSINGSCALIWIWGSFSLFNVKLPVDNADLLLLVPGLYVAGMIVDHLAKLIVDPLLPLVAKHHLAKLIRDSLRHRKYNLAKLILDFLRRYIKKNDNDIDTDSFGSTEIILYSPALGKEYVMRSSRDRIARGAFVNTVLITVIFSLSFQNHLSTILPIGIILSVLCFSMWWRFEKSTSDYRKRAIDAIKKDRVQVSLRNSPLG